MHRTAAEALGEIGDHRAVTGLCEALSDKSRDVRYAATKALGAIGDPRATARLCEALKNEDENWHMHQAAAEAQRKIGDREALPRVL